MRHDHRNECDIPEEREDIVVPIRPGQAIAPAVPRTLFKPASPLPRESDEVLDLRIAEELDFAARQLLHIACSLGCDPILANRHATALQALDLTRQTLSQLSPVARAADKGKAAAGVKSAELRGRLVRDKILPIISKH